MLLKLVVHQFKYSARYLMSRLWPFCHNIGHHTLADLLLTRDHDSRYHHMFDLADFKPHALPDVPSRD